jgi:hypothetical protein
MEAVDNNNNNEEDGNRTSGKTKTQQAIDEFLSQFNADRDGRFITRFQY